MGSDVAIREPAQVSLTNEQLQYIANTEFVKKSMRGKLPMILACVATGRSIGISDMSALRSIDIIDGKASFSAELMVSLVRRAGHSIEGNFSGDSCTVVGKRADNGDTISVTWTKKMAQEAGLLGKDNWRKYEPAMLWARAVSQLCRMLYADCFAGATYTPDELGSDVPADEADDSVGEPQAGEVEPSVSEAVQGEPPSPADTPDLATEAQRRLIFAKAKEHGVEEPVLRQILQEFTGQESTKQIPAEKVDLILASIETQTAAEVPA